ncbi:hypothetical protein [Ectobacillus sp. sgz5001026]|uniref:hypothetical protein n=1 Tax=Ectobacillus sp. sgz5001026 TaxID=3242473 RepID=UPI0036D2455A
MRNVALKKSRFSYAPSKRYRSSLVKELTTEETQRINRALGARLNHFDEMFKNIQPLPYDEQGIILDPNNPAHRDWMED